ncbi:MAG: AAA family ATPase [Thermoproteota archaeon]
MKGEAIVVTGTPGTGKTSLCEHIAKRNKGWIHLDLGRFAVKTNSVVEYDRSLKTNIIDTGVLKKVLYKYVSINVEKGVKLLIDGHYAAEVSPSKYVNCCIVLRCRPDILWLRLKNTRRYVEEKARMNVESELTDYCYLMAKNFLGNRRIMQLDTTRRSVERVYARFMEYYNNRTMCEGDNVDWVGFLLKHPERMRFLFYEDLLRKR